MAGPQCTRSTTSAHVGGAPVVGEDRPEHLVVTRAVRGDERAAQHAFLHGAELAHGRVRASVPCRDARLETMDAERVEREGHEEAGGLDEQPGTPVRRAEHDTPLGRVPVRIEEPQLQQPHGRRRSPRGTIANATYRPAARSRWPHAAKAASRSGLVGGAEM